MHKVIPMFIYRQFAAVKLAVRRLIIEWVREMGNLHIFSDNDDVSHLLHMTGNSLNEEHALLTGP